MKQPTQIDLLSHLTWIQKEVTKNNATEPPFENPYWNNTKKGIYVDVIDGTPLFSSLDQYDAGCGWPSFTKPIQSSQIDKKLDRSHHMLRTEVRSRSSDSHLGHLFTDGPLLKGGMRYCINSAALRFVPYEKLKEEGYEAFLPLFKK